MINNKSRRPVVLLAVGIVTVGATARSANAEPTPIPVPNHSFEARTDPANAPNWEDPATAWPNEGQNKYLWPAFNPGVSDIWRQFEVNSNGGPTRLWNPGDEEVMTNWKRADNGFGGEAPDGEMVVLVQTRYNDDHDGFPGVRDFEAASQILTETFDSTKTYTLSAMVGNPEGSAYNWDAHRDPDNPLQDELNPRDIPKPFYGYDLQIVVGGTVVDDGAKYSLHNFGGTIVAQNPQVGTIPDGEWVLGTTTYTPDPADSIHDGKPIQIRLAALEDPEDHSINNSVAFDDVQLTVDDAVQGGPLFRRGECNDDGNVDISDAVCILGWLFLGAGEPGCIAAANTNGDSGTDLSDAVYLLGHLFLGGPAPAEPFPDCGAGSLPSDEEMGCETPPAVCQ